MQSTAYVVLFYFVLTVKRIGAYIFYYIKSTVKKSIIMLFKMIYIKLMAKNSDLSFLWVYNVIIFLQREVRENDKG